MITQNYHTHTLFCDGKAAPQEYLNKAAALGFKKLGFSAHAEVPFENEWSIKPNNTSNYCKAINELKSNNLGVDVFLGLEADYIPGITTDFKIVREKYQLDYIIGSIHLVRNDSNPELWFIDGPDSGYDEGLKTIFNNDIKAGVTAFFYQTNEMIETQQFEIIGHFDKIKMNNRKRFFNETESWYRGLIGETLTLIKEKGIIVEVNTRGIYKGRSKTFFPDTLVLKQCLNLNIPIIVSSDAHHPDDMNKIFPEAHTILRELGFTEQMQLNNGQWNAIKL